LANQQTRELLKQRQRLELTAAPAFVKTPIIQVRGTNSTKK
jgi:hypothetical protein